MNEDSIVAISTPIGNGGISIVRLSGNTCFSIADKMFTSKQQQPSSFEDRKLYLGTITTSQFKEKALCVIFKAPNSYTGENMVEFQCHGGVKIAQGILRECLQNGARMAKNGEFSMRAFLNGKMTLEETEGMIDMIQAKSDAEVRAGYALLNGELSKKTTVMQNELTDILADIEVSFDYPEQDMEYTTAQKTKQRLQQIVKEITSLLQTSHQGKIIKHGIQTLIVGKPNVGKSSLLNALLGEEKAIVTSIAGTTRDIVEDSYEYKGLRVELVDTAGIHETEDVVEKLGIDKAKKYINQADIILFVLDMSVPYTKKDEAIYQLIQNKKYIVVKNKQDAKIWDKNFTHQVEISALTKQGINELKEKIYTYAQDTSVSQNEIILTNERHIACLQQAKQNIDNALQTIDEISLDAISVDLHLAWEALGEITGTTANEEIITAIFSKYCLGK